MWHAFGFLPRIILLVVVFLFSLISHAEIGEGLLWRIHKPNHPANYLFGTIHVDDKRVKKLNHTIKRRFDEAKTLCLEILPDRETQVGIGLAMMLPKDEYLDEILGEALFNRLSLTMNRIGMTPLETIRLKPWAAMIVLSRPESSGGYALDEQLYHWANHQYKGLCALESLQEQLTIFDQLSHHEQISLLVDTLDNLPTLKQLNEALIQAYLTGDLEAIYQQSLESEGEHSQLAIKLRERLIDHRNLIMADRLMPILDKGYAFVAVGALHLPGEKGLLKLLRKQGYIVTPPNFPINPW